MYIRKVALALGSAFMLFATTLNAQEQPWSFGVKAGGGMSWLAGIGNTEFGNNESKGDYNWIFGGGLTSEYAFHKNVGVGLEVLYTTLGGQAKEKLGDSQEKPSKHVVSTHNVVVPVMVKLFPMGCDPEKGILNMHIGVQGEFPVINAMVKKTNEQDKDKLDKDETFKKDFLSRATLSGIVGIGYEFPEIGLTLEGRFGLGLLDVMKDTEEAGNYKETIGLKKDQKLTNRSLTFSIGYNLARLLMD